MKNGNIYGCHRIIRRRLCRTDVALQHRKTLRLPSVKQLIWKWIFKRTTKRYQRHSSVSQWTGAVSQSMREKGLVYKLNLVSNCPVSKWSQGITRRITTWRRPCGKRISANVKYGRTVAADWYFLSWDSRYLGRGYPEYRDCGTDVLWIFFRICRMPLPSLSTG